MRFFNIIAKNFKLLSRSRSSAFILFIGPILIIALVGFFFSGKSSNELSIGFYAPESTKLTSDFVSALKDSDFLVYSFKSEEECVDKIKQGIIHTCIIFPEGFEVNVPGANELRFIVDYSRINLVYKVIESVSGIIDLESKEVSFSLTSVLLDKINRTIVDLEAQESMARNISAYGKSLEESVDSALLSLSGVTFDTKSVDADRILYNVNRSNETFEALKAEASHLLYFTEDLFDEVDGFLDEEERNHTESQINLINASLSDAINYSDDRFSILADSAYDLQEALITLSRQLEGNQKVTQETKGKLSATIDRLSELKARTSSLIISIQGTRGSLKSIDVTRAETIVSPVNTKIEPLVAEASNIQFTFPFLLVLIIMFASLMIASTLVIFEKNSRALFRNFMTPINQKVFIMASFTTVLSIILAQAVIILFIAQFALKLSLFSNFFSVFFTIIIAATFFIVLGMFVGYAFASQEGSVMASLVIGSTFLFISNLVVPLESIAPALSGIIRLNPFIIFSEILRKSLLFDYSFAEAILPLGILLWIAGSLLLIILFAKGFFTRHRVKMPERDNVDEITERR